MTAAMTATYDAHRSSEQQNRRATSKTLTGSVGATSSLPRSQDRDDGPSVPSASPWDGLSPVYVRSTAAQRLKALGHPGRLRIVEVLTQHPTTVGEIAARAGISLRTASRHAEGVARFLPGNNRRAISALTCQRALELAASLVAASSNPHVTS